MAAIPYHVATAFRNRQRAASGAFVSVGDALYSYALRLAHWSDENKIVWDVNPQDARRRSVTTARHVKAAVEVLGQRE